MQSRFHLDALGPEVVDQVSTKWVFLISHLYISLHSNKPPTHQVPSLGYSPVAIAVIGTVMCGGQTWLTSTETRIFTGSNSSYRNSDERWTNLVDQYRDSDIRQ
ncbi:hypothetical protein J6590_078698 [Homalodisca vitripennis]|nr:hypothetical protein J6590_078698 [Homalodisca vitripennis]